MPEITPSDTPISHLDMRRAEVAQYEANIAMYQAIVDASTETWPDRLLALRGAQNRHDAIAQVEDLDDVALLATLWATDDAKKAIRAEMVELAKSKAILAVLEANA